MFTSQKRTQPSSNQYCAVVSESSVPSIDMMLNENTQSRTHIGLSKPNTNEKKKAHNAACHRCGNMRRRYVFCSNCPQVFCEKCVQKMIDEHGNDCFCDGCPVCKKLCCCAKKTMNCTHKYHCYKKCLMTKQGVKRLRLHSTFPTAKPIIVSSEMKYPDNGVLESDNLYKERGSDLDSSSAMNDFLMEAPLSPNSTLPTDEEHYCFVEPIDLYPEEKRVRVVSPPDRILNDIPSLFEQSLDDYIDPLVDFPCNMFSTDHLADYPDYADSYYYRNDNESLYHLSDSLSIPLY